MQDGYDADDRNWALYANAAGLLVFTNVPFANLLGTFLIWRKVRNAALPLAREHARTALNFQLSWTIVVMLALASFVALVVEERGAFYLPLVAYLVLVLVNATISILGCVRASDLRAFTNPLAIPFVR
ncbi:MAG: DUF4870 domain-containing protein [bacterium]|nr:DUF4870 domain-containing protein [bacterium]